MPGKLFSSGVALDSSVKDRVPVWCFFESIQLTWKASYSVKWIKKFRPQAALLWSPSLPFRSGLRANFQALCSGFALQVALAPMAQQ